MAWKQVRTRIAKSLTFFAEEEVFYVKGHLKKVKRLLQKKIGLKMVNSTRRRGEEWVGDLHIKCC